MKSVVFLYAGVDSKITSGKRQFECVFNGESSASRVLHFAKEINPLGSPCVLGNADSVKNVKDICLKNNADFSSFESEKWTVETLLSAIKHELEKQDATCAIFAWLDCPFLDSNLTKRMIENHSKYLAEYTFADGYPYGFAPEIIDAGAVSILLNLAKTNTDEKENLNRESIFKLMKKDLNAFEIETEISSVDYRMLRLDFSCSAKANMMACKELFFLSSSIQDLNADTLSNAASKSAKILRTVPSFYNIQIEPKYRSKCIYSPYPEALEKSSKVFNEMRFVDFSNLVKQIADFSENAVISLSLWGEALYHPELFNFIKEVIKYSGLSVVIETTGDKISEDMIAKIKEEAEKKSFSTNGYEKIMWIVYVDATTQEKYKEIHFVDGLDVALNAINILTKYFPKSTYPQWMRINQNEEQLESFFRFWSAKDSPSNGNIIIQKYNDFGGLLEDYKPADLSPIERFPDWHLRRDMVILCNGDVPLYKESMLDDSVGNVFNESVESVWRKSDYLMEKQINKEYDEISRKCDEYYTFNF